MAMVNGGEELLHVLGCLDLAECLVSLLSNFVVEHEALNELHDKVDVFIVIVRFEVLDDVRVIKDV